MGLNMVMVVNNNFAGGVSEKSDFDRRMNFAQAAESMGCVGIRVERPADNKPALDQALASGRPAMVEIISDAAVRAQTGWLPPAISGE